MLRNILKLFSASAAGQALAFLLLPLIARIYTEEEMGLTGLFLSVTGLLTLFAGGRYEFSILLEGRQRLTAFRLTTLINVAFSLLLWLILALYGHEIWTFLRYEALIPYTHYIPAIVFLAALGFAMTYLFNSCRQFSASATYNFGQIALNNLLKLLPLLGIGGGALMLILSNLLSYLLALPLFFVSSKENIKRLYALATRNPLRKATPPLSQESGHWQENTPHCEAQESRLPGETDRSSDGGEEKLRTIAHRHRRFPLYALPQAGINYFAGNAVIFILSIPFGMAEIGLYTMAVMLGTRPLSLLCGALEQVLAQDLASKRTQGKSMVPIVLRFCRHTFLYGLPAFALLYWLIPILLDWYLPAKWADTATYLRLLLPLLFMMLLVAPASCIPSVVNAQRGALIIEVGILLGRVAFLWIGMQGGNFAHALLVYSIGTAFLLAIQYLWFLHLLRKDRRACTLQ